MCISKNCNVTNTFFFLIHLQKAKKRKRAEKERQQGVKRLKLQPVVKPKAVKLCNFYLMGRCQQVELSISLVCDCFSFTQVLHIHVVYIPSNTY